MPSTLAEKSLRLVTCGSLFVLLMGALITMHYGIDNLNLIQVFSADEAFAVKNVTMNLENNDLDPRGAYNYGYVVHSLNVLITSTFKAAGFNVEPRLIVYVFRMISLVSFSCLLAVAYKMMNSLMADRHLAGLSALFLASTPSLYYYAQYTNPDMMQAFLITASLFVACSHQTARGALVASAVAGLAFGTKYSGVFVLPFLFLPYYLSCLGETNPKTKKDRSSTSYIRPLRIFGLMILVFLAMYLASNPYVLTNFSALQEDLAFERQHVGRGHGQAEAANPFLWFSLLGDEFKVIGSILMVLGILAFLFFLVQRNKTFRELFGSAVNRTGLTLFLFAAFSLIYLMVAVNMRRPRYFFHILPVIVILGFWGMQELLQMLNEKWRTVGRGALLLCILPLTWGAVKSTAHISDRYHHQYVKASQWIEANYPPDVRILADSYSYQSPRFTQYQPVFGVNPRVINQVQPQLIILNRTMSGRWSWKQEGSTFTDGKFRLGRADNAQAYFQFHQQLFSETSPFGVVYETENVVILERKPESDQSSP